MSKKSELANDSEQVFAASMDNKEPWRGASTDLVLEVATLTTKLYNWRKTKARNLRDGGVLYCLKQ